MLCEMLKAKIHRAVITGASLGYEGSLSVDPVLLEAAGLREFEKILVANLANGARFETYLIRGGPGEICLNGAAARLGQIGDRVIVMAFALCDEAEAAALRPRVVRVDETNRILP